MANIKCTFTAVLDPEGDIEIEGQKYKVTCNIPEKDQYDLVSKALNLALWGLILKIESRIKYDPNYLPEKEKIIYACEWNGPEQVV